ncbi:MAG TPA: hypothetical protein VEP90_29330 [Methylomirabilota bacterium]|nr:hypothetical protein [Methylomirabilota bacterium]
MMRMGLFLNSSFLIQIQKNSEDYFSTFFAIKGTVDKGTPPVFIKISSITELSLGKDYDSVLNIDLASFLINKYLVVKDDVLSEVDDFCYKHFANRRVLGVHYRGTDKVEESSVFSYDSMTKNIKYYLKLHPDTDSVFIASDDLNFIDNIETASVGRPILYRDDSFRARDGRSIHKSAATDKYEINRDAIVNCLLLSRCDALLKTASILSGWSKLFNPGLPVVVLNRPYEQWFPERDLIETNLFEPLE